MTDNHPLGYLYSDKYTEKLPFRIVRKTTSRTVGYAYTEADAEMFAAAPKTAAERDRLKEINAELLDALHLAIAYYDHPEWWIPDAKAAIAKATGQALQDLGRHRPRA